MRDEEIEMSKGIIADIQRASIHDGDGIRTTVFFKGCPLHCAWCHNPECISFKPQILFYPDKCIGCGMCEEGCYAGAKVICGREMSSEMLLQEILQDVPYYGKIGGVTFSGGEPLAQKEFLSSVLDECRVKGINCAVETSLVYYEEEIFQKLDFCMVDLKIWDAEIHRKYIGVSNTKIKENLKKLDELGIPIIVRTPVIPGIRQDIPEISAFVRALFHVKKYELLPYHPLGVAKAEAMGIEQERFEIPDKEFMKELERYAFIRG